MIENSDNAKKTKRCVVLLSGGVDSATVLAIAKSEGYEVYALSIDYGQRHKRELLSAREIAEDIGVHSHMVLSCDLRPIGGSALTSSIGVPKTGPTDKIPVTYVPARNTIFLSLALGWAEALKAEDIFIGANAVDYSGYPDCRPEYLSAFEAMANLALKETVEGRMRIKIHAPLISMTKAEIITRGRGLGVNYDLTWSCYDPQDDGSSCGACDSCRIRARGFGADV